METIREINQGGGVIAWANTWILGDLQELEEQRKADGGMLANQLGARNQRHSNK